MPGMVTPLITTRPGRRARPPPLSPGPSGAAARWPSSARRSRAWCSWRAAGPDATPAPRGWVPADVDSDDARGRTSRCPCASPGRSAGRRSPARRGSCCATPASSSPSTPAARTPGAPTSWTDDARFACLCHDAFFDLDGNGAVRARRRARSTSSRVREIDGRIELLGPGRLLDAAPGRLTRRRRGPRRRRAPARPRTIVRPIHARISGHDRPPVSIFYPPADRNAHARSRPLRPVGCANRRAPAATRPNRS